MLWVDRVQIVLHMQEVFSFDWRFCINCLMNFCLIFIYFYWFLVFDFVDGKGGLKVFKQVFVSLSRLSKGV